MELTENSTGVDSSPCLPAKKRLRAPPDATASVCLPAKKRVYPMPPAAPVPECLPAKKRAYAPPPDATVSFCLPAKKRGYAPPPYTAVFPCLSTEKRVCMLPASVAGANASVPVCLPANKRVSLPFIPPASPPSVDSDAACAATAGEAKAQEPKKAGDATNPDVKDRAHMKITKVIRPKEAKGQAFKKADGAIDPKEVKDQESKKARKGVDPKEAKVRVLKKAGEVVSGKEANVQEFKIAEEAIGPKEAKDQELRERAEEAAPEPKQEAVEEDEDGVLCAVCGSTDGDPSDPIVFCDGCDIMVHASCYGNPLAQAIPDGDWFCSLCSAAAEAPKRSKPARATCCLCPARGGAMKRTTDGRWAHIACALLVPEVFFRDPDGRDGIDCSRVPGHRFATECYICDSTRGCALECSQPRCGLAFHISCGLAGGLCIEYREAKGGAIVAGFCTEHTKIWEKQQLTGKYKIVARQQ